MIVSVQRGETEKDRCICFLYWIVHRISSFIFFCSWNMYVYKKRTEEQRPETEKQTRWLGAKKIPTETMKINVRKSCLEEKHARNNGKTKTKSKVKVPSEHSSVRVHHLNSVEELSNSHDHGWNDATEREKRVDENSTLKHRVGSRTWT